MLKNKKAPCELMEMITKYLINVNLAFISVNSIFSVSKPQK
jgi:hypothetical protein